MIIFNNVRKRLFNDEIATRRSVEEKIRIEMLKHLDFF